MNAFAKALSGAETGVKKGLRKAGNAVASVLPQIGSVKVDNAADATSAYSMAKRKNAAAGPPKAFKMR